MPTTSKYKKKDLLSSYIRRKTQKIKIVEDIVDLDIVDQEVNPVSDVDSKPVSTQDLHPLSIYNSTSVEPPINILKYIKSDRYNVLFTEKHRSFFIKNKDRIFSNRIEFNKSIVSFNIPFAESLHIYSPKTTKEYDDFIKSVPQRILSIPEGECAVIVSGIWKDEKTKVERIIHSAMVYNNKGKYYIFNPNDTSATYDDGFYDCYSEDNDLFIRPLRIRKKSLHYNIKDGACFVISYMLKLLCEMMTFNQFLTLVTKKTLKPITKKCFDKLEPKL